MNPAGVSYLLKTQHAQGGWGYSSAQSPSVEATAAAILALHTAAEASRAVEIAVGWLSAIQNQDGGWGLTAGDQHSGWHTSWALLVLALRGKIEMQIQRGRDWLLAADVYRVTDNEVLQAFNQNLHVDFSLHGWSWGPGEASWVQPTALALLALRGAPLEASAQARVDEAVSYLANRRVPGGGWNVGNPAMFDGVLPAHAIPTSLALLALQHYAPDRILPEDYTVLQQEMVFDGGAKALAYGLLALKQANLELLALRQLLEALQQPDGSWEMDPFSTSLVLLALDGKL